ncbi:SET domain-containing protein [Rozella allomycis CSF55]|uniref:SET domain-containing protein n=1 Tax=Rozella allomycis (strain CSF55) TaxID=988480 RepID=A0A075B0N8_ROZAC|nr:SET domain-containing protein [Rozella allomycis CSF55]|eukprot:EPZ36094.1 SET domain-containing protein [Rozella allomycis CSF55]
MNSIALNSNKTVRCTTSTLKDSKSYNVYSQPLPYFEKLPSYSYFIPTSKNIRCEDDPVLRHIPYLGDDKYIPIDELYEAIAFKEDERKIDKNGYLAFKTLTSFGIDIRWLKTVYLRVIETLWSDDYYIEQVDKLDDEENDPHLVNFLWRLAKMLNIPVMRMLERVFERHEKSEGLLLPRLHENVDDPNSNIHKEKCLESYQMLFCTRCYIYDCHLHRAPSGRKQVESPEYVKPDSPCGDSCFLNEKEVKVVDADWTSVELAFLHQGVHVFGNHFCNVSKLIKTKSCIQVYLKLSENPIQEINNTANNEAPAQRKKTKVQNDKLPVLKSKSAVDHVYYPCNHPGTPCNNHCSCFSRSLFCEKYCHCDESCSHRFPGCKCKGPCDSKTCPCVANQRECDPDLCLGCGASVIQRNQGYHVLVAKSSVAGWGAFVKNFIKKDEFIGEYCGEIISQNEADRRGRLYDRLGTSFLFNLDDEFVIDATRKGNALRFANHSVNPNCYAKILRINGDCRIGIFALNDLKPAEELFFDYRYGDEAVQFVPIERKNKNNQ